MSIEIDTNGLDRLARNAEELDGEHQVSTDDLMTDAFIQEHTEFQTWQEMMDAGGIQSDDDIGGEPFSKFVGEHSDFASFDEMVEAAGAEWVQRQLFKGL
jgi:hypothetical protein